MTDSPRLSTPLIHVVLADGATFDVQTHNPEMVAWDRERAARKWPKPEDGAMLWLTYLSWKALRRERSIDMDLTFDNYIEQTLEVSVVDHQDVDPTQMEATPDSS